MFTSMPFQRLLFNSMRIPSNWVGMQAPLPEIKLGPCRSRSSNVMTTRRCCQALLSMAIAHIHSMLHFAWYRGGTSRAPPIWHFFEASFLGQRRLCHQALFNGLCSRAVSDILLLGQMLSIPTLQRLQIWAWSKMLSTFRFAMALMSPGQWRWQSMRNPEAVVQTKGSGQSQHSRDPGTP